MNLKEYIETHKPNQSALSRDIGVDFSCIWRWCATDTKKIRMPNDDNMEKIELATNGLVTYRDQYDYWCSVKKNISI
jgi:hypothetical protein